MKKKTTKKQNQSIDNNTTTQMPTQDTNESQSTHEQTITFRHTCTICKKLVL